MADWRSRTGKKRVSHATAAAEGTGVISTSNLPPPSKKRIFCMTIGNDILDRIHRNVVLELEDSSRPRGW